MNLISCAFNSCVFYDKNLETDVCDGNLKSTLLAFVQKEGYNC